MYIMGTSSSQGIIPEAVTSRFHVHKHSLTIDVLKEIVLATPNLKGYQDSLDFFPFKTVTQVEWFNRFKMDSMYSTLISNSEHPNEIVKGIDGLIREVKNTECSVEDVIGFFIPYCLYRIHKDCAEGKYSSSFKAYVNRVVERLSPSLFKYMGHNASNFYINLESQIRFFFLDILILKTVVR